MLLRTQAACAVAITAISTAVNAQVVLGPGDVFQQADGVNAPGEAIDLTVLDGGRIIERSDGGVTRFLNGPLDFQGGSLEARMLLNQSVVDIAGGVFTSHLETRLSTLNISGGTFQDTGQFFELEILSSSSATITGGTFDRKVNVRSSDVDISGGTYNQEFELDIATGIISGGVFQDFRIDRHQDGEMIEITGGTFLGNAVSDRANGDLFISGGDFQQGLSFSRFQDDTATITLAGSDWLFGGLAVDFGDSDSFMLSGGGLIEGFLADGNAFSLNVGSTWDVTLINVPAPGTAAFGLLGFAAMRRRR